jgi:hypothetical protein
MKRWYILIAVSCSYFAFCTNENPTEVSATSGFRDSIVMDLFSFNVYNFNHFKQYYGSVTITEKGQTLLQPLDTVSTLKSFDTLNFSTVIVPTYVPSRFEAWVYDSIPLVTTEESDPEVLVKAYSFSMNYFFRLDSAAVNIDKCIKPVEMTYKYGYGFVIREQIWGTGKLKIYYE